MIICRIIKKKKIDNELGLGFTRQKAFLVSQGTKRYSKNQNLVLLII